MLVVGDDPSPMAAEAMIQQHHAGRCQSRSPPRSGAAEAQVRSRAARRPPANSVDSTPPRSGVATPKRRKTMISTGSSNAGRRIGARLARTPPRRRTRYRAESRAPPVDPPAHRREMPAHISRPGRMPATNSAANGRCPTSANRDHRDRRRDQDVDGGRGRQRRPRTPAAQALVPGDQQRADGRGVSATAETPPPLKIVDDSTPTRAGAAETGQSSTAG